MSCPARSQAGSGPPVTSTEFIWVLATREIKISMDGKGAWRDNPRAFPWINGGPARDHQAHVADHQIRGGLPAHPFQRALDPRRNRPVSLPPPQPKVALIG